MSIPSHFIIDDSERKQTVKDYFNLFWKQVSDWESKPELAGLTAVLKDENLLHSLSDMFCDQLGSPLIPLISIRIFRIIIKRLFGKTADYFREHPEVCRSEKRDSNEITNEFPKWIVEIFHELVPVIDTKGVF